MLTRACHERASLNLISAGWSGTEVAIAVVMLKRLLSVVFLSSLTVSCVASSDGSIEDPVGTNEAELRDGIILWLIEYDTNDGSFTVGFEVHRDVIEDPGSRYLVAELRYDLANGAGVSPFAASPIDSVDFRRISRDRYYAELVVEGPRPRNPDDVRGRVSANPTPHP